MSTPCSRRTFLTGLAAVAAAPALPALSHGEYAGEGVIGVTVEWIEFDGHIEWLKLYPDAVRFTSVITVAREQAVGESRPPFFVHRSPSLTIAKTFFAPLRQTQNSV